MPEAIPHILHQTWRSKDLPGPFAAFRATWIAQHPAWEHRFYDDADCRALVESMGDPWPRVYSRLPTAVQRADVFRYLVVYRYGGLYADMDMECLRPADDLVHGAEAVFSIEKHMTEPQRRLYGYRHPRQIANCIFAAAPGNAFLRRLLAHIERLAPAPVRVDRDVEDTTGPRMLTRVFESLEPADQEAIRVLPQVLLMAPRLPSWLDRWAAPHARHHFAGTWKRDPWRRRWPWRCWTDRHPFPPLRPRLPFPVAGRQGTQPSLPTSGKSK